MGWLQAWLSLDWDHILPANHGLEAASVEHAGRRAGGRGLVARRGAQMRSARSFAQF